MASVTDKKINNYAIRTFRNVADRDYIAARLAFRADLMPQFMWMAEQALEKYLKAILCFYRVPAMDIGHDLAKGLRRAERLPFKIEFTEGPKKVVDHIATYGPYRYLEAPWFITGHPLPRFDMAVWQLRRYCQAINHERLDDAGRDPLVMKSIESCDSEQPQNFKIIGGLLEEILETRDHPAREPLLWQNICYASRRRRSVKSRFKLSGENPPLMHSPEILDDLLKLVYVPADVQRACREVWGPKRRAVEQSRSKSQ